MKNTKIILTDIEKEKLLTCVGLVAKDFKIKRYEVEDAINKIERGGGRAGQLLDLLEHYRDRQRFYEDLERKVERAIENNQI